MSNSRKDTMDTLGTVLDGMQERDAVHIAVMCVKAVSTLTSGQHIGIDGTSNNPIGIVDPFLHEDVKKDQWFWLFLYPKTITGLKHNWTHPAVDRNLEKDSAEEWLRKYADEIDTGFKSLVQAANDYIEYGDYFVEGGKFESLGLDPRFWEMYEIYTGKTVDDDKKHNFFSCSC